MFYRKLLRICSSFLMVLMCCSIFASAAYPRASPRIGVAAASLSKDRYGDLCIEFRIRATDVMDTIGVSSIRIERYNGSRWIAEDTLTEDDISGLLVTNASSHDAEVSYSPLYSNGSYRAVVSFYAEDREGSSTKNVTTKSV